MNLTDQKNDKYPRSMHLIFEYIAAIDLTLDPACQCCNVLNGKIN